tara:strand:+ start:672 stop:884 length:213 start_codon:yes stop_codon:yes gene_type:complete
MNNKENNHHLQWDGVDSSDIIKSYLTIEEYQGFLKGNLLKYQLRLGKKDSIAKDMAKIEDYRKEINKNRL